MIVEKIKSSNANKSWSLDYIWSMAKIKCKKIIQIELSPYIHTYIYTHINVYIHI